MLALATKAKKKRMEKEKGRRTRELASQRQEVARVSLAKLLERRRNEVCKFVVVAVVVFLSDCFV